ncbi:MAG: FecR domain-containing protein [Clostridium sp.]|nr:FecR domain-containing protein [Clostridium sp.]
MTSSNKEQFSNEREKASAYSDDDLAMHLRQMWEDGDFPAIEWPEHAREKVYGRLASKLFNGDDIQSAAAPKAAWRKIVEKTINYAAAILIPILLLSALYFYNLSENAMDGLSLVRTGQGETATLVLPDGSEVKINRGSTLSYSPYSFSRGQRRVALEGEAFFSVQSDKEHPFIVEAGEVSVKVLGTKFNVQNYPSDADIEVLLSEGAVEMLCEGIAKPIILEPWQKGVFDKTTGMAEILQVDSRDASIAWLGNEIAFSNAQLCEVALEIEKTYGVNFDHAALESLPNDGFTGVLPSDDLSTALDILEDVYGVCFSLNGRQIVLY